MDFFNKKMTMIYIEDRVFYIATFDNNELVSEIKSFDIPVNVVQDGRILDSSQLHYLLKQALEEGDGFHNKGLFIVNTTDAVNRAMHVPEMTEKEIHSLIENESDNLFVQDLDDYRLEYVDLENGDDMHHLLVTICADDIVESYMDLAKGLQFKIEGFIPYSTLLIQHAHRLGGGRIGLMTSGHDGFYYAHENRYYGRTEKNAALIDLMNRYDLQFSELERLYKGQYDERLVDIDHEDFQRDLQSAFYESLMHIENIGDDFALEDAKLLSGSFAESGLYDLLTSGSMYTVLPLKDVLLSANENRDEVLLFQKRDKKVGINQRYILPIVAVVLAFVILIGTFIYGEKIKQENRELIVQSTNQEQQQQVESPSTKTEEDIAGLITTVKSSVPDSLSITTMEYQGDTLEISGEGTDSETIETWRSQLESTLKKSVNEEPSATIGDTIYFKFSISLSGSNGSENTGNQSDETMVDETAPSNTTVENTVTAQPESL